MGEKIYGYCRISTRHQRIDRQKNNILSKYPSAIIIEEAYTGTTTDRPLWNALRKKLVNGDTVVFDEVSRLSRNAEEGIFIYRELFEMGINLVFLKEPHINTDIYKDKLNEQRIKWNSTGNVATDKFVNNIMDALFEYTIDIAKEQIRLAFVSAEEEVDYLHKRTSEGIREAQKRYQRDIALYGKSEKKPVGRQVGSCIETKKSKDMKKRILELSKDFNGHNLDKDVMRITQLSRNTFYKYKKELLAEFHKVS